MPGWLYVALILTAGPALARLIDLIANRLNAPKGGPRHV